MKQLPTAIVACMFILAIGAIAAVGARGAEPPAASIGRWLSQHCLECHSGAEPKGGLDLTRRARAAEGGDSGPAFVADKPDESQIWKRVEVGEMPPKRPLNAAEKRTLRAWLAAGAKWDVDPIDPLEFSGERRGGRDWWSFQPVRRPSLPGTPALERLRSPIDAQLEQRLAARQLTLVPPADPRTLIRRLTFDLLGLPPTPEEIADFVADGAPDAYERLVDRLLASPRLGERSARHWLDVAHFGESDGFEYDRLRPHAWRYRDWVIEALNRDLPYDEFARQQIAGDVLEPESAAAITATGFLVGGAHDGLLPAVDLMRQIMRQDELEDLVGTLGQTFLGLTVHCARCHDHKFDPIAQSEYYRLASALAGVRRGDRALPSPENSVAIKERLERVAVELERLESAARKTLLDQRQGKGEAPGAPVAPQPVAAWDFTRDLRDRLGALHGTAHGEARQSSAGITLDGALAYVSTAPLSQPLRAKTLAAVVQLANLEQRGGGVISVQALDGSIFDAIVFGERDPGQWMAGSNGFVRTHSFRGEKETLAKNQPVHVAIAYDEDGTVRGYLNGKPYGESYKTSLQAFAADKTQVVFGLRHGPVGGNRMLAGTIRNAALYDRALSPKEIEAAARTAGQVISEEELVAALSIERRGARTALQAERQSLRDRLARTQDAKAFAITPGDAAIVHVLGRGSPLQKGEVVTPGGIRAIRELTADFQVPADAPDAQRRRGLAAWVTSPRNALFARTISNRLWHYHFGLGLVPTPNDLGFSGGLPSHPELLDWLAAELIEQKFSLKALHRQIVTSSAYRQSSAPNPAASAIDADNRLLWRKSPQRLEAEGVRDAILSIAGQLNLAAGGPGFQDFRPFLRGGTQFYEPLDPVGPAFQRRSIYRTWARGGHNQLLDTFDCPDPSTTTPRRSVTTTPLQALSLLNHGFVLRMSDHFAQRLASETDGDSNRAVRRAYELACGRPPTDAERQLAEPFAREHGLPAFCRVLFNSNAFLYVD